MRRRLRRPSPAMAVACLALFVALGGAALATTQPFTLGTTNTVNAASAVTNGANSIANPLLTLTNSTTGTGATALKLNAASGHAPFAVNSATKVASLNADLLDGLDSTTLQRRVSGACASGTAIRSISSTGTVACQDTRTTNDFSAALFGGGLPYTNHFNTHGGPVLILFSGSGFRSTSQGPGTIELDLSLTNSSGVSVGGVSTLVYSNETLSHRATVPVADFRGLAASTYQLVVSGGDGTFNSDDFLQLEIIEFPH